MPGSVWHSASGPGVGAAPSQPNAEERSRRAAGFAARVLFGSAIYVLIVHTSALALTVHARAAFVGDDVIGFWLARSLPWHELMLRPIDVHFVPLHRLASLLLYVVAPMKFGVGLAALLGLHVTTLVVLYRMLAELAGRTAASVLVCAYGLHPCVGALLTWWTSGLHRLGCVLCVVCALSAYVAHRRTGSRLSLVRFGLWAVASVGFYSKGVLIPLYVAGLQASLAALRCQPGCARRVAPLGLALTVAAAYVAGWYANTETAMHAVNTDPEFVVGFTGMGLRLFVPSLFGIFLDPRLDVYVGSFGALAAVFVVTVWTARAAVVPWAFMVLALAANMALLGAAAAKTNLFGIASLWSDRYYFENVFVVVLFLGVALRAFVSKACAGRVLGHPVMRAAGALAVVAGLVALSVRSFATFEGIRVAYYAGSERARAYMENLEAGLAALPPSRRDPLVIRDSSVTPDLVAVGDLVTRTSSLLVLMGETVRVSPRARYAVAPDGSLRARKR